jgi:hypothetical protein
VTRRRESVAHTAALLIVAGVALLLTVFARRASR